MKLSPIKKFIRLITLKGKGPAGRVFLKEAAGTVEGAQKSFVFKATYKDGLVGRMETSFWPNSDVANVVDTKVMDSFRKQGISKKMFGATLEKLKKLDIHFLRGEEILHPGQVKIRSKYHSKFIGHSMGKYWEDTRVVSPNKAANMAALLTKRYEGSVKATTMVPKTIKPIEINIPKDKIRFIRKNGRIIPIRTKK